MSTIDFETIIGGTIDSDVVTEITVDGDVVWSSSGGVIHETYFNSGIPSDWDGIGRYWPDDDEYNPLSWSSGRLGVTGQSPTGRGFGYPVGVDQNVNDWRLEYRADVDTGSSHHQYRRTGGFHTGDHLNVEDYDTRSAGDYWVAFEDIGDTLTVRAETGSGSEIDQIDTGSWMGDLNNEWDVVVESSAVDNELRIKFWETGTQEPDGWFVEYSDRHIPGRPAFMNYGEFHNSRTCFYDYYILTAL